jgi:hypothetical protein
MFVQHNPSSDDPCARTSGGLLVVLALVRQ